MGLDDERIDEVTGVRVNTAILILAQDTVRSTEGVPASAGLAERPAQAGTPDVPK